MRKTRDEQNRRLFERDEWLTKSQVQGFFSRLAASRRRQQAHSEIEHNPKELFLEEKEAERQQLMAHISNELRPLHPLSNDAFNLCECARDNKLSLSNVSLLKEILRFFEIPFKSRDRKKNLIEQLMSFIQENQCFNECNTRAAVGITVSIEPWQTSDRAFRVNLLKSNVHRL